MPLYKVSFKVTKVVHIPVCAETIDQVKEYIAGCDEWLEDGAFYMDLVEHNKQPTSILDFDPDLVIAEITHPKDAEDAGWEANTMGWCETLTLAEALYPDTRNPNAKWEKASKKVKPHPRRE